MQAIPVVFAAFLALAQFPETARAGGIGSIGEGLQAETQCRFEISAGKYFLFSVLKAPLTWRGGNNTQLIRVEGEGEAASVSFSANALTSREYQMQGDEAGTLRYFEKNKNGISVTVNVGQGFTTSYLATLNYPGLEVTHLNGTCEF